MPEKKQSWISANSHWASLCDSGLSAPDAKGPWAYAAASYYGLGNMFRVEGVHLTRTLKMKEQSCPSAMESTVPTKLKSGIQQVGPDPRRSMADLRRQAAGNLLLGTSYVLRFAAGSAWEVPQTSKPKNEGTKLGDCGLEEMPFGRVP
jgi:hypothetical protein